MRTMPRILSDGTTVPTVDVETFNHMLNARIGKLSDNERQFVDKACSHGWALTVIVDEIRLTRKSQGVK